ncbi:hypothetical protein CALCODRAFT_160259 [Calocera cornea HHB12733]|uniref:Uncharacterized protein n=1 Tax=Calocera cornea HHB12733 TaxID=1353952 RepID=A0A165I2J3_9BASI|nr:hypothetical protein CALCODRAFT_160259 [Calocera cornea HHB12733]
MAEAAGIALACGNCLVGVFQQWWYTKHYGSQGFPGTERKATFLAVNCGFNDDADAESIYEHMAAATDAQWEAYLLGQPLPRKPMTALQREATLENEQRVERERREREREKVERPELKSWPTDVRPALQLITNLQDTVGGRVLPAVKRTVGAVGEQMDVAKRLRGELDEPEAPALMQVVRGAKANTAEGKVVRRDVTVPPGEERGEEKDVTDVGLEEHPAQPSSSSSSRSPPSSQDEPHHTAATLPRPAAPTGSLAEASTSRTPAAHIISPSVLPPNTNLQPTDPRLSGETETVPESPSSPTSPTVPEGRVRATVVEIEDPLLPASAASSTAPTDPVFNQAAQAAQANQTRPTASRLPLGLPAFLKPAVAGFASVTAPVATQAGRLRPALGVLDQAKGGRGGSRDSMIERETDPSVYRRLADA